MSEAAFKSLKKPVDGWMENLVQLKKKELQNIAAVHELALPKSWTKLQIAEAIKETLLEEQERIQQGLTKKESRLFLEVSRRSQPFEVEAEALLASLTHKGLVFLNRLEGETVGVVPTELRKERLDQSTASHSPKEDVFSLVREWGATQRQIFGRVNAGQLARVWNAYYEPEISRTDVERLL